jgi:hypothetical protein
VIGDLQVDLATRCDLEGVIAGLVRARRRPVTDVVVGSDALADNTRGQKDIVERKWGYPGASSCYIERKVNR